MNYAKLLEISSFFIWHIFLKVGKTQDMPNKIWQTAGDALKGNQGQPNMQHNSCKHKKNITSEMETILYCPLKVI